MTAVPLTEPEALMRLRLTLALAAAPLLAATATAGPPVTSPEAPSPAAEVAERPIQGVTKEALWLVQRDGQLDDQAAAGLGVAGAGLLEPVP